ncbi:EYxxD motif small membrane protein [Halobacillus dabanensis]
MEFLEYFTDVGFVIAIIIGSVAALFFVGMHKRRKD